MKSAETDDDGGDKDDDKNGKRNGNDNDSSNKHQGDFISTKITVNPDF